jgi:hypothetical protein
VYRGGSLEVVAKAIGPAYGLGRQVS